VDLGGGPFISQVTKQRKLGGSTVKDRVTVFRHNKYMPDERPFTLRQVDQARGDLYAIADDIKGSTHIENNNQKSRLVNGVDRFSG
jgi:hypothetical protein